jgi:protease-4
MGASSQFLVTHEAFFFWPQIVLKDSSMTHDIDHILNHISLKKRLKRWRWFAIGAVLVALIAIFSGGSDTGTRSPHVARLYVNGLITGSDDLLDRVRAIGKDDNAKAMLIRIDSPGGTTAGSEALYLEIRKVAEKKPVVAVMDTIAASGGYITAIAADHIVARGNTITGSIGVIFSYPDASKLLDIVGIKMEDIKSAELKAEPSPYKPTSEKARAVMQEMVVDGFDWFKGLVSERRKITPDKTAVLADGRVYSGRQALANGLIDELGAEDEAMKWLSKEKKIDDKLEIVTWSPAKTWQEEWLGSSAGSFILRGLGLERLSQSVESAKLDGLLVLWHPSL